MSVEAITAPSTLTFDGLSKQLGKAYGYGIRPDHETINRTLQLAAVLASEREGGTKEEFQFFKQAMRIARPTKQGVEAYRAALKEIEPLVKATEKQIKDIQKNFSSKTKPEQGEILASESYSDFRKRLACDSELIANLASETLSLLYTRVAGAKTDPVKSLDTFLAYRAEIIAVYRETLNLLNLQMQAALSAEPSALCRSDPTSVGLLSKVVTHRSLLSIPAGLAVAAAGAYLLPAIGLSAASTALTYGLGTLIAASPAIARTLY